jgi:tartrate/fumarate subfamily iron-sulfur-dependent hydro-lyase beta chain
MILVELKTPLSEEEARGLRVGDRVALSGTVFTMRDQATMRLLSIPRSGGKMPLDLRGGAIYHAGPAVKREGGKPRVISIGPTTSARMNAIMPEFIENLGIRLVVGKGGMDERVLEALGSCGCAYAQAIGGCSALYTGSVKELSRILWEEMGPEAVHELQVDRMKPLTITMDSHGRSLHADVERETDVRLAEMLGEAQRGEI